MLDASHTGKWTAFLLSACVPGAGQLAARSWTCLAWFIAAGLLAAAIQQFPPAAWLLPPKLAAGIALALLSAEHAKRLLEPRSRAGQARVAAASCNFRRRGRLLDIEFAMEVARSQEDLWRLVGDLPRFLTIDPFHDRVTLMRDRPAVGVDLLLSHNAFGRRFLRFGRIVAWDEGSGYTFSDLSSRGSRVGFPHVFIVRLAPADDPRQTRLSVQVRGRWTSRLVPVWLGMLWVWLVCREHARLLRKAL